MQALWQEVCQATGGDPSSLTAVERFGDSAAMADELLALVLAGTKTATAGLARDFEMGGEPLSQPGDHRSGSESWRAWTPPSHGITGRQPPRLNAFSNRAERGGLPYDEQRDLVAFERFKIIGTEAIERSDVAQQ